MVKIAQLLVGLATFVLGYWALTETTRLAAAVLLH